MKWWLIVLAAPILFFIIWILRYVTTPPPGIRMEDLGRDHVSFAEVEKTTYNSNPPTSGPHVVSWVKPGVFDKPQLDAELIHSLEHGYVVISYNCTVHLSKNIKYQNSTFKQLSKFNFQKIVYAHETGEEATDGGELERPKEASGSAVNETDACKTLIKDLTDLANKKKLSKLIVVPRPNLDTTFALTAWTYIDKFDEFDAGRIERFIDYHRDHGPEQTME